MGDDGLLGVLSADLWRIILQSLPLPSIRELRLVNKAFYELCAPVLLDRLHLASSSATLFLYFPSTTPTHELDDFLLVLQGHSHKCFHLPLPSHFPPGFFLRASGGGLLLFCDSRNQVRSPRLLVYNPILECWKVLPRPPPKVAVHFLDIDVIHGTSHYNVVVVNNNTGWVAVYHSETEDWDTVKIHHYMEAKAVYNGSLYWVVECYQNFILKVTTLSTRIYETSREEVVGYDPSCIFGVATGRDGAAVLNVHFEGRGIGNASKVQETDGKWTWIWSEKMEDDLTGSRIAYAGGVLCNIPWEADSFPYMLDLKSHSQSNIDRPLSNKPFVNDPDVNYVLPFQPSCTPVTHNNVNNGKKEKGCSTTKGSSAINSFPSHHKSSLDIPL